MTETEMWKARYDALFVQAAELAKKESLLRDNLREAEAELEEVMVERDIVVFELGVAQRRHSALEKSIFLYLESL